MPYPLAACHSRLYYPAGSATPVIPPTTGAVGIWAVSGNLNPVGYPGSTAVTFEDGGAANRDANFGGIAPYGIDWQALIDAYPTPYALSTWWDASSSANNLSATGDQRPTLQITSSVEVTVAGTAAANGTYTYRGQSGGKAYYNLEGQPDDVLSSAVTWDGVELWHIKGPAHEIWYSSFNDVAFPWLATWFVDEGDSPAPTVSVSPNQSGEIQFNGSTQGLAGANPLYV